MTKVNIINTQLMNSVGPDQTMDAEDDGDLPPFYIQSKAHIKCHCEV